MEIRRGLGFFKRLLLKLTDWVWLQAEIRIYRLGEVTARPPITPSLSPDQQWIIQVRSVADQLSASDLIPANLKRDLGYAQPETACATLRVGNEVIGWGFVTPVVTEWPITETGTTLRLDPPGICLISFEVEPRWRGRRVYPTLLEELIRRHLSHSDRPLFIWCRTGNGPSRRAIERRGFVLAATHQHRCILGMHRRRLRPASRPE